MTMLTLLFALAAPPTEPPPIQFDALTVSQARQLAGDARITFTPRTPAYTGEVCGVLRTISAARLIRTTNRSAP